ncbi:MAG TPA: hypothetical protein VHM02_07200 [Thermoanaerobaculia bacterium]|nr:hypothetical protein [Thermoanaerobaculia bacterium]
MSPRPRRAVLVPLLLAAALAAGRPLAAQEPPAEPPEGAEAADPAADPADSPQPADPADPAAADPDPDAPGTADPDPAAAQEPAGDATALPAERGDGDDPPSAGGFLPSLDVFFPEGDLDLRANRLINKVFFEGQVQYNFIDGDITAYLRYRYYGYRRTYQITAFDAVEFDSIEELSDEFERVRGFLFLTEWPQDYHHRAVFLGEIDRIISNKEVLQFDTNKTNTFVRAGYQIGTPYDPRSNAILGERRASRRTLFTAFRDVGPGDFGLTAAATYGFDFLGGDFEYVKVEAEGLKRFDLWGDQFLIGRLRGGSFPLKEERRDLVATVPDLAEADRYTIPRAELFRLDGRDNLKGVDDPVRGTEQLYTTWELFVPWFVGQDRRALGLTWDNWYWILYAGYGMTGFDSALYSDLDAWVPDVGIGFESSFRLRKYTFFLSGIVAQALEGEGDLEATISIKSHR